MTAENFKQCVSAEQRTEICGRENARLEAAEEAVRNWVEICCAETFREADIDSKLEEVRIESTLSSKIARRLSIASAQFEQWSTSSKQPMRIVHIRSVQPPAVVV